MDKKFDMWEKLNIPFGGYSESIDRKIIDIIKYRLETGIVFCSSVAENLGIDEDFVELVYYILCSSRKYEYGTSPRGCWSTNEEEEKEFIVKCEEQFKTKWIDTEVV